MRDIDLKATEHFEAVARPGSVTRVAGELMVSPSAVSQQIRQIEAQLGVKLFRREKRRLEGADGVSRHARPCAAGGQPGLSRQPARRTIQLAAARLVDSVKALLRRDVWLARQRIMLPRLDLPLQFDRSSMSIKMARQGFGVALESTALCLSDLKSGALVPALPGCGVFSFAAYWFVCPPQHVNRRIVRLFADWLTAEGRQHDAEAAEVLTGLGCTIRAE